MAIGKLGKGQTQSLTVMTYGALGDAAQDRPQQGCWGRHQQMALSQLMVTWESDLSIPRSHLLSEAAHIQWLRGQ